MAFMQSRVKFYKSLIRQTEELGLKIEFGSRVFEHYEDSDAELRGVEVENGGRREADVVVAADGIRTHSGEIIFGEDN